MDDSQHSLIETCRSRLFPSGNIPDWITKLSLKLLERPGLRHLRDNEPVPSASRAACPLEACRLTVAHVGATVLHGVDLALDAGALTVLVGPNGCGKSTLLKAMGGLLAPSSGEVRLDGRAMGTLPRRDVARRMALLPQGPVAPEGLTVRELVAQGRFPYQSIWRPWSSGDARAVEGALEATDLPDLADRRVSSLSGGQRQRAWIAMTLAQETDIILLDEPTTYLDLRVQVEVMALLRRIAHEAGRTLLVVLHELNVAAAFADRLVMMRSGRIRAQGPAAEVLTEASLRDVFGLDARVLRDPDTQRPICVPRTQTPRLGLAAE